ncbi:hypothetical protein N7448_008482 [Penicillium atrosanguineum]|uniref:Uncharacterized protein n=1 Tax=Penicillium atrosanguineum TaxID=1132637 RepID=A0A9W9QEE5_9EURO|nr:uncharacterized protein N7443_000505 [Penicillium atrosanguineum]KAJ5127703.1 hypothetical protein N7448_008482 [Penicillium atrosanguineum]KAJ5147911.1 hypothetical protein N7526_001263 [Penicillium atrosanguineum]KAJ5313621.1 hypothetical protein N7443_000505 [Penicillium atrosanguineum]KAJ5330793.1 hypothetical protein N7476_000576 [Penicillium atrosanguineum]
MNDDPLPQGEVIGIVIGAIVLFSIISIVPMWLAEQHIESDPEQYAQDTCPICLSSLLSNPYLTNPEPTHLAGQRGRSPAHSNGSCSCGATDSRRDSGILVLNRCHHAFHLACLTSWFEYRRYRCPICQESYSPAKAAQR